MNSFDQHVYDCNRRHAKMMRDDERSKRIKDDAKKAVQDEAIEAGVAEWRINPKTGEKSFEWKKPEAGAS